MERPDQIIIHQDSSQESDSLIFITGENPFIFHETPLFYNNRFCISLRLTWWNSSQLVILHNFSTTLYLPNFNLFKTFTTTTIQNLARILRIPESYVKPFQFESSLLTFSTWVDMNETSLAENEVYYLYKILGVAKLLFCQIKEIIFKLFCSSSLFNQIQFSWR